MRVKCSCRYILPCFQRRAGNTHYYRLDLDALQEMQKATLTATQVAKPVIENIWETKVLNSFVEKNCIKEIPASRKKRRIILKWLVQKFEVDRIYSEQELNETHSLRYCYSETGIGWVQYDEKGK
jgi:hypothetical protein